MARGSFGLILDHIDNIALYQGLPHGLYHALKSLTPGLCANPPGRYDLDGDNLFALVQEYDTRPRETATWEAHRKYIDIQYMIAGTEVMGCGYAPSMTPLKDYDEEKDFALFSGPGSFVAVSAGMYAIFFPSDAHMPCLAAADPEPIKKVVLKVIVV